MTFDTESISAEEITVTEEAEYFIAEGAGISVNVWEADGVE